MARSVRAPRSRRRLAVERLERRAAPSVSPVGGNFLVNTTTAGAQDTAAVAMDADGDFVAAWSSSDGSSDGIFAQRYSASGTALGGDFRVNTFTTNQQTAASVAISAVGDFVVVWESSGQDGDGFAIYGQRYSAAGTPLGSEFRVNQTTAGNQLVPAVACDAAGNFAVVWQGPDGDGQGVFARLYDADGTALGGENRVNTFTTGDQRLATVGMDGDGDFVVAWQSAGQDGGGFGVFAQRFAAAGTPAGGEFQVNTFAAGDQTVPSVACDAAGNFTVAWQSTNQGSAASGADVVARRYNSTGTTAGAEVLVSGFTNAETAPVVARDGKGDTVITWTAGATDIRYRILSSTGTLSAEVSGNTYTTNAQSLPAVSCDAAGDFVLVWSGEGAGDAAGVFGQRFDESTDVVGPRVAGVYPSGITDPVAAGERLVAPPVTLLVAFAEDLSVAGGVAGANSVTNPANWSLTRNGVAAGVAGITYAFNNTTRRFEATLILSTSPLAAGTYVLTATPNLRDLAGNALDGDGDGTPGGAFVRNFGVATPVAVGPETPVNQTTAGNQRGTRLASDAAGNTVVVWQGPGTNGTNEVFARRYSAAGAPLGDEFRVNTHTAENQFGPSVAVDADGDFVVAWTSTFQDGDLNGAFAQRYDRNGVAQGAEFRVNQVAADDQGSPRVAMDPAGNFTFAWTSDLQDGNGGGIFARRYDASGTALGDEFLVNVTTAGSQFTPDIAADADGDFVVAWVDQVQDGSGQGIYARRFQADGVARGGEFRVNIVTTGEQIDPSVAADAAGNFLIAWTSQGQDGSGDGVFARRYSAAGVAQIGETAVNATTLDDQSEPTAAMDADGDAVIAWQSDLQDGDSLGVFARRLDAAGNPVGTEFRVNTFTTNVQELASAAMDADGDFVIAWHSLGQDGNSRGIYLQRYGAAAPPRVTGVVANPGATDRSRVLSITVTFDAVVTFSGPVEAAFGLSRIGGGAVGGFTATNATVNGVTVVTLSGFTGAETEFGSLADGRYAVLVRANQVTAGGGQLDGDGNGTGGDDFSLAGGLANGLFRLYGDANGDGLVNAADFSQFRPAFGTATGNPLYRAFLDFNGDGQINAFDFAQFRNRFGNSVP